MTEIKLPGMTHDRWPCIQFWHRCPIRHRPLLTQFVSDANLAKTSLPYPLYLGNPIK